MAVGMLPNVFLAPKGTTMSYGDFVASGAVTGDVLIDGNAIGMLERCSS